MAGRQRPRRRRAGGRVLLAALLLLGLCCRAAPERIRYAIPEELGRGSLVGPLARDLGLSPAELPARKLRLSAEKQYFGVSGESGQLYVSERLDREEMCGEAASCSVSFEALLHNPLNVFHVQVDIHDVNDNDPAFSKAALGLEIPELTLPGARFPLETARDPDVGSNALLTYQLTSSPSFSLALKESSGGKKQPELVLERALDREEQSSFQLVLTAVDGGDPARSGTVQILVNVTDANDNAPIFREAETELRMSEMTAPGSRFPLRDAQDPDVGRNSLQSYELSGDEHFSLAVQAGPGGDQRPELVLAKALDREEAAFHELVLRASDGGEPARTGTARIRVAVLDANDNAPVFSAAEYTVRVAEDVSVGSTLLTLTATDADDGMNGHVKYSFKKITEKSSQIFQLDSETGAVTLMQSLDFEEAHSYQLEVQARDGGGLSDTAKVSITVSDVNDNAPQISVRSALSEISEDAPSGTVVALLHVQDRDSGANGEVRCSLAAGVPFRLEKSLENYYRVVTTRELDREEVPQYNVTVRAADGGSPSLRSSAVLALRVLDVNDNAPVFAEARYSARLAENNAAGALVLRVRAADADWGQNARVRYRLREGRVRGSALSSYVSVQAETGALYALRSFDYEEVREVGLWVVAEDGGAPALSSNVSVRLEIVDENDNAPQQAQPNTDWRFSQTQRPGTSGSQNGEEGGAWPNNQFDTEMLQAMILASANEAADANSTLGGGTGTMGLSARYGPQFTLQHVPDYRQNVYIPGSTATLTNAAGKRDAKATNPSGGNKKKSGKKEKK
ncbi:protocadherin gamma-B7-like isoform X3 [Apus apus]|uniref:protocadherin gamma-B7-like isoform X3 n=1 Tax=Apus apus TaxID=8895 RepID=UPI0021F8A218|nr:protocadherin gamma-B7-like isoform X3 [Apus apus]